MENNDFESLNLERRTGTERRTGKLNDKFDHSVKAGVFMDLRRGERRKFSSEENIISLN